MWIQCCIFILSLNAFHSFEQTWNSPIESKRFAAPVTQQKQQQQHIMEEKFEPSFKFEPIMPLFRSIFEDNPFPTFDRKFPFENFPDMLPSPPSFPNLFKNDDPFMPFHAPINDNSPLMPIFSSSSVLTKSDDKPISLPKTLLEINDEINKEMIKDPVLRHRDYVMEPKPISLPFLSSSNKNIAHFMDDHIMDKIHEEENGSSNDRAPHLISISVGWSVHTAQDNSTLLSNETKEIDSIKNKLSLNPLKEMIHRIMNSFMNVTKIFGNVFHNHENINSTDSITEIANTDETPVFKPIMIQCDCPEDKHEENCPNMERKQQNTNTNSESMDNTKSSSFTSELDKKMDNTQELRKDNDIIENTLSEAYINAINEIKEEKTESDSEYEWYHYLLIVTVSAAMLMLCIIGALVCIKRQQTKQIEAKTSNIKLEIGLNKDDNKQAKNEKKESLIINM